MPNQQKKPVFFIDLDGTLYDDRWRLPLVDSGSQDPWDKYHRALVDDKRINHFVLDIIQQAIQNNSPFYFLTARPEKYRKITWRKICEDLKDIFQDYIPDSDNKLQLIMRDYSDGLNHSSAMWKVNEIKKHAALWDGEFFPISIDNDPEMLKLTSCAGIQFVLMHHWKGESQFESKTIEFFSSIMKIHSDRHALYGQNYLRFGPIMKSLMGQVTLKTEKDWNRIAIIIHMLNKLTRYCSRWGKGGHQDSLDDLAVYSLILKEIDEIMED